MSDYSRRSFLKSAAIAGGALSGHALLSAPAIARDLKGTGTVSVFDGGGAWGEAKRIAYFEPFERETGIKVIRQPRGDTGTVRASIQAGAPRYDVANLSGNALQVFAREGLLQPIDYGWFDSKDRNAFHPVPASEFGVPALFYSLLIAYDARKFADKAPKNWSDVWDAKAFPGGRTLASGTWGPDGGTYEAALLADGVSPDKLYPIDWDRAFKSLSRIRPDITKYWASGAEAVQLIIDRQVSVGSAWNGRVSSALDEGAKLGSTWNQGILQWDGWAVPKGVPNRDNAMKFIAFASRAENQAKFAQHILYGPTNARAFDFIPRERAVLLPTFPALRDQLIVQNYEFWNAQTANGIANHKLAITEWEKWLAGAR